MKGRPKALLFLAIAFFTPQYFQAANLSAPAGSNFRPGMLFQEVSAPISVLPLPVETLRIRYARIQDSLLDGLASRFDKPGWSPSLRLNLFEDVQVDWVVDRVWVRPGKGWVLCGRLTGGNKENQVVMAYRSGIIQADIFIADRGKYQIRYAGQGVHRISEVDPEGKVQFSCQEHKPGPTAREWVAQQGIPPVYSQDVQSGCPDSLNLRISHLMILYTPQARVNAGGTTAMETLIDLAWAGMNMAFYNSAVTAEMEMVHTEEVSYTEAGNLTTDLIRLSNPSDGFLDQVPALMGTYGANYVSLMVASSQPSASGGVVAGLGYLPGFQTVVLYSYADVALPHELGHNFGCQHDRATEGIPTGNGYNYGHRFTAAGKTFITIMSYQPGSWILYFSNPMIFFSGYPTGIPVGMPAAADNAKVINHHFPNEPYTGTNQLPQIQVASPADGTVYSVPPPSIAVQATASDPDGSVVQVDFFIDNQLAGTDTTPPFSLDWVSPPPGIHYLSAHAVDDQGGMRISCPIQVILAANTPTPTPTPPPFATPTATIGFTPDVTVVPTWTSYSCLDPIRIASVNNAGVQANGGNLMLSMSWDGRFVVFSSDATNLVAGDTAGRRDIFLRDRVNGTTQRISVGYTGAEANGPSDYPVISGDGLYIAYESEASNLVSGDTNGGMDVFLYDRTAGTTRRVSVGPGGIQSNGESNEPALSGDGRYVAFTSIASNLVPGDTYGLNDAFVYDRVTQTTQRVSLGNSGQQPNEHCLSPVEISAGGRFVVYHSFADNLVPVDNYTVHLFVYDRATFQVSLIGPPDGNDISGLPSLSPDGRYFAFTSIADNLMPGDVEGEQDVFLADRKAGTIRRISQNSQGVGGDDNSYHSAISADAQWVIFHSIAGNLLPGVQGGNLEVYRANIATGALDLVSRSAEGVPGNGKSSSFTSVPVPALSGDGLEAAFSSFATNLVSGDANSAPDIFVACMVTLQPTATPTPDSFATPTITPTSYIPDEDFPTLVPTPTQTATNTLTLVPTLTFTDTLTPEPTSTFTHTFTSSETMTPSFSPTRTHTCTSTPTPTFTLTETPSSTPTITSTPTATAEILVTLSNPYPNPSHGGPVTFRVKVPSGTARFRWDMFTTAFRKIAEGEVSVTGQGIVECGFLEASGRPVANGLYYLRMRVEGTNGVDLKIFKLIMQR